MVFVDKLELFIPGLLEYRVSHANKNKDDSAKDNQGYEGNREGEKDHDSVTLMLTLTITATNDPDDNSNDTTSHNDRDHDHNDKSP